MNGTKPQRLIIIGGVAGGATVAARARRLSEQVEIVVLERGSDVSFAHCGLPYFVGGEIPDRESLLMQTPETLRSRFNLDVRVQSEVTGIDRMARTVRIREVETGRKYTESYDALILAMGAGPEQPAIPGIQHEKHFTVRGISEAERIIAWTELVGRRGRMVVVGGGYIGLEMAEQLRRAGCQVTVVEALPQVISLLDPEMAAWLHLELRENRVGLHLGDPVVAFEPPTADEPAEASIVVLESGLRLPADGVILALGVKPESGLAAAAGLEIGKLGGIRVNASLQTSDPHIWAVGDVIEVRDGVTGQWTLIPMSGPADRQGRIAANNIFGRSSRYEATWGTTALRLFGLTAACTGANARTLRQARIPYQVVQVHPGSHAGYYPGAKPIALKLLFAPGSGKILGAQAVGREGVDKRIDVIATALQSGLTVHHLAELELAYAPPFGSARDPVNVVGMAAENVLAGDVTAVGWEEITPLDLLTTVLLDVRENAERDAGFIPDSIHIPLNDLRGNLECLPKDKIIVVYCHSGQRAYYAARLLAQHGFTVRNLSGAYRSWLAGQS